MRQLSIAALAAASLIAVPGVASADVLFNSSLDLTGQQFSNPCTGEPSVITGGLIHVVVSGVTNANGSRVSIRLNNQNVTAESASGTTFRLTNHAESSQDVGRGADHIDFVIRQNYISQGAADNCSTLERVRATTTPNGDVTGVVIEFPPPESRG